MRSKIILILALLMGVATTVLFFNYMKQFDTETVAKQSMTTVVAAKEKILKNELLNTDKLMTIEVPSEGLQPNVITSMDSLSGKYATAVIEKGEILLEHRVLAEKEETIFISRKVSEGNVAVSIGVNFVQSVSNLVEPEDYVNVIFSEVVQIGDQKVVRTEQILNKVRVLAVNRRMIETQNENEPFEEFSAVTLELSPSDSVKLVNAMERGNLHLAIHTRIIADVQKENNE